jgi:hypothetical protein
VFVIAESVMTASLFLALVSQVCASAYEMTAHADRGSDFKTQHVLERNQNTDFGLGFWPKQIRMDWCKNQIMARLLHIALCGGGPISSQIL